MATVKELFTGLENVLEAVEWTAGQQVFGEVRTVPEWPIEQMTTFRNPACFLLDNGSISISNHNQLQEQRFIISLFVRNAGERHGRSVMMSGNRTPDTSKGVGIFDVEQKVMNTIRGITQLDSAQITLISRSKIKTKKAKSNSPYSIRNIEFTALVTLDDGANGGDPSVLDILRSPGFLYWNPPSIPTQDFGTKLGFLAEGLDVDPGFVIDYVSDESGGVTPTTTIWGGNRVTAVADFWSYTEEVIELAYPGFTSGKEIRIPNARETGESIATGQLLFVPENLADQYIVVLNDAVPQIISPFSLRNDRNTTFRIRFTAQNTAAQFYMGPIGDF